MMMDSDALGPSAKISQVKTVLALVAGLVADAGGRPIPSASSSS